MMEIEPQMILLKTSTPLLLMLLLLLSSLFLSYHSLISNALGNPINFIAGDSFNLTYHCSTQSITVLLGLGLVTSKLTLKVKEERFDRQGYG